MSAKGQKMLLHDRMKIPSLMLNLIIYDSREQTLISFHKSMRCSVIKLELQADGVIPSGSKQPKTS